MLVCRALGLPSRVVSNLVSAHDANSSLTVDKYYTETMEELDIDPNNPQGADSIWNYHVWNDVWMARPDLPPGETDDSPCFMSNLREQLLYMLRVPIMYN